MKKLLILKASKDISGDQIGLINYEAGLLGIEVKEEVIYVSDMLKAAFTKYSIEREKFDYLIYALTVIKTDFKLVWELGAPQWIGVSSAVCSVRPGF